MRLTPSADATLGAVTHTLRSRSAVRLRRESKLKRTFFSRSLNDLLQLLDRPVKVVVRLVLCGKSDRAGREQHGQHRRPPHLHRVAN